MIILITLKIEEITLRAPPAWNEFLLWVDFHVKLSIRLITACLKFQL